jgi:hypothetical protein
MPDERITRVRAFADAITPGQGARLDRRTPASRSFEPSGNAYRGLGRAGRHRTARADRSTVILTNGRERRAWSVRAAQGSISAGT